MAGDCPRRLRADPHTGNPAWALRGALIGGIECGAPKAGEAIKVIESLMDFKKNVDLHWVFVPRAK